MQARGVIWTGRWEEAGYGCGTAQPAMEQPRAGPWSRRHVKYQSSSFQTAAPAAIWGLFLQFIIAYNHTKFN